MSLVKQSDRCCSTHTGSLHLRVVPHPEATTADASMCSNLSDTYLPHMNNIVSKLHTDGVHHGHAQGSLAAKSHGLQQHMVNGEVCMKAMYCPQNTADHAIVAQVSTDHLNELLTNGQVSVEAPLSQGTFHLHSARENYITGMEFEEPVKEKH